MLKRLLRGSIIGIFLGLCGGIVLSYAIRFKELAEKRNEAYIAIDEEGQDIIETNTGNVTYGPECHDLQDVVLRFHVKANSNSDEDLALKYSVRNAILYEFGDVLQSDMSRDEMISYLEDNLDRIEEIAVLTMSNLGYSYPVEVYISNDYFPIRQYGEMIFPAGYYEALRVDIGQAEGENFWCLLYPMTCYPLDTGAVVSKEDEKKLEEILSREEYEKLFIERDTKEDEVKIKLKFLEWLGL